MSSSGEAESLLREEPSSSLLYPDPWSQSSDKEVASTGEGIGVFLNLLNAVTGPSLLLSPFAFFCAGAIGGVLVLLLALCLQMVSIYCLVVSAHLSGRASYRGLTSHYIGLGQGLIPRLADLVTFVYAMGN
jgi:amino acid permease